jgi:ribosomal RNA-processing protein 9
MIMDAAQFQIGDLQIFFRMKAKRKQESSDDEESIEDMKLGISDVESEEELVETATQKRLRLAKGYLSEVAKQVEDYGEIDAAEMDRDLIAERLQRDELEISGRAFYQVAERYVQLHVSVRILKAPKSGPHGSFTSVGVCTPNPAVLAEYNLKSASHPWYIYGATKDAGIVKWNFFTGERLKTVCGGLKLTKKLLKSFPKSKIDTQGHNDSILCLAISSDGKFIVSTLGNVERTYGITCCSFTCFAQFQYLMLLLNLYCILMLCRIKAPYI